MLLKKCDRTKPCTSHRLSWLAYIYIFLTFIETLLYVVCPSVTGLCMQICFSVAEKVLSCKETQMDYGLAGGVEAAFRSEV